MSRIPTDGIDYTSKDYESFRNDMITHLGIKMPEYTDIRQSDAGIVILELLAQGLDVISYYQDVIANEAFLVTEEQRVNAMKWCKMLGYTPKSSTPAEFTQVFVLSSAQETDTVIPAGTAVKTQGTSSEPSIYFETVEDLVIPAGALGNEMQDEEYLYTTKVVQGISVLGELLGSSTGSVSQSFKLNYSPVILTALSFSSTRAVALSSGLESKALLTVPLLLGTTLSALMTMMKPQSLSVMVCLVRFLKSLRTESSVAIE